LLTHPNLVGMPQVVLGHQGQNGEAVALGDERQGVSFAHHVDDGRGSDRWSWRRRVGGRRGGRPRESGCAAGKHAHLPPRRGPSVCPWRRRRRRPRPGGRRRIGRSSSRNGLNGAATPNHDLAARQHGNRAQGQHRQSDQDGPAPHRPSLLATSPIRCRHPIARPAPPPQPDRTRPRSARGCQRPAPLPQKRTRRGTAR